MKQWVIVVVVAVLAVLVDRRFRASPPVGSRPSAADAPGEPGRGSRSSSGFQRLSATDAELDRMRAEVKERTLEQQGPTMFGGVLDFESVRATIKARFGPGEKPTPDKVRLAVNEIMSEPDKRWASTPLARVLADCKAGKMDDFLAVLAPSVAAGARREQCATHAPKWREDILRAYKDDAEGARVNLDRLKGEIRENVPADTEAGVARVESMLEIVETAIVRLDGRK